VIVVWSQWNTQTGATSSSLQRPALLTSRSAGRAKRYSRILNCHFFEKQVPHAIL